MEFTESVLRSAPWSFSKHEVLQACELKFYKKYVKREREEQGGTAARIGTTLHTVLEKVIDEPELSAEDVLDVAAEADGLTTDERRDAKSYLPPIENFRGWLARFCVKHDVTARLTEFEGAIKPDFTLADYNDPGALIRGKVDLGLYTRKNDLIIIDHKSGKKKPLDQHAVQLSVYRLFAIAKYPEIRSVQPAIHYVSDGKLDWDAPMTREQIVAKTRPWLVTYLNKHDAALQRMTGPDAEPPAAKPFWGCEYCGYVNSCEKGKDHVMQVRTTRENKKSLKLVDA